VSMLPAVASLEGRVTLEIRENFRRARETIHCRRLRLSLSYFGSIEAAEVVGGFDHVDSGTRCVTYVDACYRTSIGRMFLFARAAASQRPMAR
jgi:hypothetical protein